MPSINDYSSRKEWEAAYWERIIQSKELLQLLTTSHERHDLVMRAAAIDDISVGKTYRKIGEELWLSHQTISGIKKAVSERGYKSYLERSKKDRKKKNYSFTLTHRRRQGTPRRTKYGKLYMP